MNNLRFLQLPLLLLAMTTWAHGAPSPQEILAASDAIRNPDKPFRVTSTLTAYRSGKQSDANSVVSYCTAEDGSGKFLTLLRFVTPQRDANKLMLKVGNELWFFDPSSKATVRVSPQQRLLGQAANGDILSVNLAKDYRAELAGEEEVLDGDRKMRRAYKLMLTAVAEDVTYYGIEMWVDVANSRPIKAYFYTESRRLLKTAYYRRFQMQLGVERPTETVIIDGLDPSLATILRLSDYAWRDVPKEWMQRDYLPQFKAE